jgi:hypothetical protein
MGQLSPQGYPRMGARVAVAGNRASPVQAFPTVVPAGGPRLAAGPDAPQA